jgi:hypothetical protein
MWIAQEQLMKKNLSSFASTLCVRKVVQFVDLMFIRCINNASPAFPANFKRALQEFDVNEDGLIDYGEFLEIDRRYPLILFPAFRLQDVMQRNSLGICIIVK